MGTKFGNIHVKTNCVEEVISALKELVKDSSTSSIERLEQAKQIG